MFDSSCTVSISAPALCINLFVSARVYTKIDSFLNVSILLFIVNVINKLTNSGRLGAGRGDRRGGSERGQGESATGNACDREEEGGRYGMRRVR